MILLSDILTMILLSVLLGNKFIVMIDWRHPKTIIGPAAEGENYFRRPEVEGEIWRELGKGSYVLFNAPRRTGKSSIMNYMTTHCQENMLCHYEDISSDDTAQKFYERLLRMVLQQVEKKEVFKDKLGDFIQSIGIESVSATGVKFNGTDQVIDRKAKLLELLPKMKDTEMRMVLFLDEFPDTINNIASKEGKGAALDILQTLRSLTNSKDFREHFCLVLAGSIGLDHVVKKIDRTAKINFYRRVKLKHLDKGQPIGFLSFLTEEASMEFTNGSAAYLVSKLNKPIPYFIQLLVESCNDVIYSTGRTEIQNEDIDRAWELVLDQHEHFQDWVERLEDHCKDELPFLLHVLTATAHNGQIDVRDLYNIGVHYSHQQNYKALIDDILIRDGYLEQDDQSFSFVSPLLQEWWKNRYPVVPA